jgi:hypothetical protein
MLVPRVFGAAGNPQALSRRDQMKMLFLASAGLAVLSGCVNQPRPALEQLPDPRAIQTTFFSRLTPPASGTFTVSYSPRDFAEPADVRVARDQYIRSRIILALSQAGMTYKDLQDPGALNADYEVSYTYSTYRSTVPLGASAKVSPSPSTKIL